MIEPDYPINNGYGSGPISWIAAAAGLPPSVIAIAAGTVLSWLVTQRFKFFIPFGWSHRAREIACQTISFIVGFVATFYLWPNKSGFVAALIVGLWSPALWSILTFIVGIRWPRLRDRLSQDVRPKEKQEVHRRRKDDEP